MNPERLNRRTFADAFEPAKAGGQFAHVGKFEAANVGGAALLAIATLSVSELKQLAKFYGWKQGGNVSEVTARLIKNWATLRHIENIGRKTLEQWTNANLDAQLIDLGLTTIGNKPNKVVHLLNWAASSRHAVRTNLAERVQMLALQDALLRKAPVSVELVKEHGIQTAAENFGYTMEGDTYLYVGKSDVFTVDDKAASRETLERMIAEAMSSLTSWTAAVGEWLKRMHETFQQSTDGTLTEDMTPVPARNKPGGEYSPRWAFSARHVGTCFHALTNAVRERHLREARLRYLEGVRVTATRTPAPVMNDLFARCEPMELAS